KDLGGEEGSGKQTEDGKPAAAAVQAKPADTPPAPSPIEHNLVAIVKEVYPDPLTEEYLRDLAKRERKGFYALAADYGVKPGRGVKLDTMVVRILAAIGVEPASSEHRIKDIDTPTRKDVKAFLVVARAAIKVGEDLLK